MQNWPHSHRGGFAYFLTPFNRLIMRFFSLTNSVDRQIMGCVPKFFNGFSLDSKIVSSHLFFYIEKEVEIEMR